VIHPHTELRPIDDVIGLGVFATRRIPKGTIVWTLDALDQKLTPEQLARLGPAYRKLVERYAYPNEDGHWILCWDLGRWVNHSCEPNALSTGWEFDLAVRDIEEGEQITNDYSALNLEAGFVCLCGEASCRKRIRPSDFESLAPHWDERVRSAGALAASVEQPLWQWISNKTAVRAAFANPAKIPSILRHRLVAPRPTQMRRRAAAGLRAGS
jgi:hypothetical protein